MVKWQIFKSSQCWILCYVYLQQYKSTKKKYMRKRKASEHSPVLASTSQPQQQRRLWEYLHCRGKGSSWQLPPPWKLHLLKSKNSACFPKIKHASNCNWHLTLNQCAYFTNGIPILICDERIKKADASKLQIKIILHFPAARVIFHNKCYKVKFLQVQALK